MRDLPGEVLNFPLFPCRVQSSTQGPRPATSSSQDVMFEAITQFIASQDKEKVSKEKEAAEIALVKAQEVKVLYDTAAARMESITKILCSQCNLPAEVKRELEHELVHLIRENISSKK